MKKRILAFCFACAVITTLSARPAHAMFVSPVPISDTTVQIGRVQPFKTEQLCDGVLFNFNFLQRMKIDGQWMSVPTENEYERGKMEVIPVRACSDGSIFYGLAICGGCLESVTAAASRETPQAVSLNRLNRDTRVELGDYRSYVHRGEPGHASYATSKALAAEIRRRQLLLLTVRT